MKNKFVSQKNAFELAAVNSQYYREIQAIDSECVNK